jgi:hypothetical protein
VVPERNKEILDRFDALLGTDDLTALDELCTPDMVNHAIAPDRPTGLAGTREFLETMARRKFGDHAWHELTVVAEGPYVVQFGKRGGQWFGRGVHGGRGPGRSILARLHGGVPVRRRAHRRALGDP